MRDSSSTNPDLPAPALPPQRELLNHNFFMIHFSPGAKKVLSPFLRRQPWWQLPTAAGLWVPPPPLFTFLSQLRPLPWVPPLNLPQANCPEFFQGDAFFCLQCDSHCKCLTRWWSPLTNTELIQSKASSNFPGASYQLRSTPSQWVRPALNRCPLCWGTSWFLWLPRSNRGRWDLLLEGTFSIFQTKRAWSGSC